MRRVAMRVRLVCGAWGSSSMMDHTMALPGRLDPFGVREELGCGSGAGADSLRDPLCPGYYLEGLRPEQRNIRANVKKADAVSVAGSGTAVSLPKRPSCWALRPAVK